MAGRGRGLSATLPAWMQQQQDGAGAPGGAPAAATPGAPPGFRPPAASPQPGAVRPPGSEFPPRPGGMPPQFQPPAQYPPQQRPPHYGQMHAPPQGMHHLQAPPAGVGHAPASYGALPPPPQLSQQPPGGFPGAHMMGQFPRPAAHDPAAYGGALAMAQPRPAAAAPAAQASPAAKPKWTQHTSPKGRPYWYNAELKKSTWEKPADFQAPDAQATAAAAKASPAASPAAGSEWKEFTAPDGRKYYHNKATGESKWTLPDSLKAAAAAKAAADKANAAAAAAGVPLPSVQVVKLEAHGSTTPNIKGQPAVGVKREDKPDLLDLVRSSKAKREEQGEFLYATKEEAKDGFKELLASVDCASDWTWEQTLRLIISDRRYSALKSLGEKKACFKEYQDSRAKQEKEDQRAAQRKARDDFVAMLDESRELKPGARLSKAAALFDRDPRWKGVPGDREREELLVDHLREKERREKESRKAEEKKRRAAFRQLLESSSFIKATSVWRKVQGKLEGEEAFEACDKFSRLEEFEAYIRELDKAEQQKREKEREERRRKERKHRDAFKALLDQHRQEGLLHAKLRWKEYFEHVRKDLAYIAVEKNVSGSRPKELFEDCIEQAEKQFIEDRSKLKDAIKEHSIEVGASSTYDDFVGTLDAASVDVDSIILPNRKLIFEELLGRAKEREAKQEARLKQARDDYSSLLRHTRDIQADTTWAEAEPLLQKDTRFKEVAEADRLELFYAFVERLKQKRDERAREKERDREKERVREEERSRDKKRHKKDRHSEKDRDSDEHKRHHKSSKRHHSDDDDKRSKRHKKDKDRDRERKPAPEDEAMPQASEPELAEAAEAAPMEEVPVHMAAEEEQHVQEQEQQMEEEVEEQPAVEPEQALPSPVSTPRSKEAREEGEL